jgi:hypothetical protein
VYRASNSSSLKIFGLLLIPIGLLLVAATCPAKELKPLSLHPENPHYFLFRGKPTVLITSAEHYGAVLNLNFDYVPYLNELHAKGLNHTRTFSGTYREVPTSFGITENTLAPRQNRYLSPWARSKTPGYFDGGNKFDLNQWDEAYFRRLRDFVAQASKRGIVVELNLFCPMYEEVLWQANPLNATNNINGIGNCSRDEIYTLAREDVTRAQKAVVRKIVASLVEFDNVYYEVCNEPYTGKVTLEWQEAIAATIREAELRLPTRHLISLNLSKQKLTNEFPDISIFNFHYAAPPDVVAQNYGLQRALGDNETGFRGKDDFAYRTEAWDFILAGGALVSSLDYSFTARHPDGTFLDYKSPGGGNPVLRTQLGFLNRFIHELDFIHMTPSDALIAGGVRPGFFSAHMFAEPGRAYVLYLRTRTDADRFAVRWTGSISATNDMEATISVASRDSVRLWIDDQLMIENAKRHELTENECRVRFTSGRPVAVRLEYAQVRKDSVARLLWSAPNGPKELIPVSALTPPEGPGKGLKGEYFEDRTMKKQILSRVDRQIDFDWAKVDPFAATNAPAPSGVELELPPGSYNAQWIDPKTGRITNREKFKHSGKNYKPAVPKFSEDIALKLTRGN